MEYIPGYYSLLQYCPDFSRSEVINIGVLVSCPSIGFLDIYTTDDYSRVERLFKGFDKDLLNLTKNSIISRIKSGDSLKNDKNELEKFLKTRANILQFNDLRPLKTNNPETELQVLFGELVEEKKKVKKERTREPDLPELDLKLRSAQFHSRVRFNEKVVLPLIGKEIEIPYAFQNGKLNLIKPQKFFKNSTNVDKALVLACEGDLIQRHRGPQGEERKLIVIPVAEDREYEQELIGVFAEYRIETFRKDDVVKLLDIIDKESH